LDLSKLDNLGEADLRRTLKQFFERYRAPAFGALPKREIDLLVFAWMRELEIIEQEATAYSLMTDLRITRTKAMQLLFDSDMRTRGGDEESLNGEVKKAITALRFIKEGNWVILEIENPLVHAHLKSLVQRAKHISDSSFSPSIVKLTPDALADVLVLLWENGVDEQIEKRLKEKGLIKDTSWKGAVVTSLKHLGKRYAGDGIDIISEKLTEEIRPLVDANIDKIIEFVGSYIKGDTDGKQAK
jgi:hypothetical protein